MARTRTIPLVVTNFRNETIQTRLDMQVEAAGDWRASPTGFDAPLTLAPGQRRVFPIEVAAPSVRTNTSGIHVDIKVLVTIPGHEGNVGRASFDLALDAPVEPAAEGFIDPTDLANSTTAPVPQGGSRTFRLPFPNPAPSRWSSRSKRSTWTTTST